MRTSYIKSARSLSFHHKLQAPQHRCPYLPLQEHLRLEALIQEGAASHAAAEAEGLAAAEAEAEAEGRRDTSLLKVAPNHLLLYYHTIIIVIE